MDYYTFLQLYSYIKIVTKPYLKMRTFNLLWCKRYNILFMFVFFINFVEDIK